MDEETSDAEVSASSDASLSLDELLQQLDTSRDGLSDAEAQRRLAEDGPNAIEEHHRSAVIEFLSRYWGPIPWMIEVALVLSIVVGHWSDAVIIGALLVMNGLVSFWEEHQAGNAIEALKKHLATTARVERDGTWCDVAARDLVRGDVIRVRLGDVVPADAHVLGDTTLEVDQSALTGESLPVERTRGDALYSGSVLTLGEADAVVSATGSRTYFGRTTQLVETAGTVSHFQRAILRIARYLIILAVALVTLILVVGVVRGNGFTVMLEFALVVAVASIPVALPAVLSVTMAVGAGNLAKQQAVVSHLAAVEELGGVDVLCADKTGTLTQNRLAVGDPYVATGVTAEDVLGAAALASERENRDPIDLAVVGAADRAGATSEATVIEFEPFDPVHKRTTATVETDGARFRVAKGAPQVIFDLVDDPSTTSDAEAAVERFAAVGSRSLGVARADDGGPWRLLGVLSLADPPRDDSAATIQAAHDLGVTVKMVTGDQQPIAREIAREVGLGTNIEVADVLGSPEDDETVLAEQVEHADGYAQVFPEHKYRIVKLLQGRGHLVGMTGDGVNDAPALKQADAGIAVDGATDAARAAADIVLLAPGLSVIVEAIRTSREIFARMTSYAIYRIAETIRVLLFVTAAILVFNLFPVTAIMIVLLALLNDGAILAIAYDRATAARSPAAWQMRSILTVATVLGIIGVVASFGMFVIAHVGLGYDEDMARSLMYLKLSVAGHFTIFITRTRGPFWKDRPAPILLWAVLGTQAIATLIAVYGFFMTPIGWWRALFVWAYALSWFVVNDLLKLATYRYLDHHPHQARSEAAATT
jgi:H+-transporting ATPase